ncbi:MAG: peptidoglycan-binding protein LysM [Myxococcota bacterium]
MGLFDFVRNIGKKVGLGNTEQDQAAQDAREQIQERQRSIILTGELRQLNLDVQDLVVEYDDGRATLRGMVPSAEISHKLIMALGNMEGVAQVDDQTMIVVSEAAEPVAEKPAPIFHTVQKGESLSLISKAQYGCIHLYPAIFDANQPMIKDADEIFPGQVLTIPPDPTPLVHTVKSGETLSKIARYHYGDMMLYPTIFDANRGVLDNPDVVEIGQQLTIPLLRKPAQG